MVLWSTVTAEVCFIKVHNYGPVFTCPLLSPLSPSFVTLGLPPCFSQGMKRFDARKAVLEALKEKSLYKETKENAMVVPVCRLVCTHAHVHTLHYHLSIPACTPAGPKTLWSL